MGSWTRAAALCMVARRHYTIAVLSRHSVHQFPKYWYIYLLPCTLFGCINSIYMAMYGYNQPCIHVFECKYILHQYIYKGSPLKMVCHVLVTQMTQIHMQYLYIGAGMVFGITQQCDFCCV